MDRAQEAEPTQRTEARRPAPQRPAPQRAALLAIAALAGFAGAQQPAGTAIPRTWDEDQLATMELPNAVTGEPARHVPAAFYEAIPATVIYRTWPVYHPDHEPEGYLERLRQAEPELAFDAARIADEADWIRAGELVFGWPINIRPSTEESRARFRASLAEVPLPVTADGIIPFQVYVIREKGRIEVGSMSCATCHTRVMPDGSTIVGAQGNFPFDPLFAPAVENSSPTEVRVTALGLFGMPRVEGVEPPLPADLTAASLAAALRAIPPGVMARHGTSAFSPVQIPDLIGIADRRYLDRTGLVRHRGIGDLMRYAALNQDLDRLADWDGFVPDHAAVDALAAGELPAEAPPVEEIRAQLTSPAGRFRYSDAQLYALAKFLYALEPPPSPHPDDERARRGAEVFAREDCGRCHPAPLYTSNELTPVPGFAVPAALRATDAIRRRGVGTDPTLATTTRRGTGFYKVPSLRGVWYRGPFSHDGSVATLEDWFDPRRLEDGYRPTGWNPGGGPRPVRGHRFGLDLEPADREALLAFLRTL
jgi:hypothetical protein